MIWSFSHFMVGIQLWMCVINLWTCHVVETFIVRGGSVCRRFINNKPKLIKCMGEKGSDRTNEQMNWLLLAAAGCCQLLSALLCFYMIAHKIMAISPIDIICINYISIYLFYWYFMVQLILLCCKYILIFGHFINTA